MDFQKLPVADFLKNKFPEASNIILNKDKYSASQENLIAVKCFMWIL